MEQLNTIDCKCHAQEIIGKPVFLHDIPDTHDGAEAQTDQVMGGELVVKHRLLGVSLALGELEVKWNNRNSAGDKLEDDWGHHVTKSKDAEHKEVKG